MPPDAAIVFSWIGFEDNKELAVLTSDQVTDRLKHGLALCKIGNLHLDGRTT